MSDKFAAIFPGQGSQTVGMGQDFSNSSSEAKALFERADDVLGFSLSGLCKDGPQEELTKTFNAQPALLVVGYMAFKQLGKTPLVAAGHSLGEYTALLAAEVISFEDAVKLVHLRGKFMQEAVPAGQGGMAAVIGGEQLELEKIVVGREGEVEIANLNCPGQTVVSGTTVGLEKAQKELTGAGFKFIPLQVSAPFHSTMMKPAAERLSKEFEKIFWADPKFPVYSNVTCKKISSAEEAKKLLLEQLYSPVRWSEQIASIISDVAPENFLEFGPGAVLCKLLKRIDRSQKSSCIFDSESLLKVSA